MELRARINEGLVDQAFREGLKLVFDYQANTTSFLRVAIVFPTYVGVNRPQGGIACSCSSIPYAGGDGRYE